MKPISICTIMKNEEKHLTEFITSIKTHMGQYPYELILLDTGSTDKSIDIASEYGVQVYHKEWDNNFASMRNYAASLARNDLILVLDCDEYIRSINPSELSKMMENTSFIGNLTIQNRYNTTEGYDNYTTTLPRIYFKSNTQFIGSIHEQLVPINRGTFKYIDLPIYVEHVGYAGSSEEMTQKTARNIDLLMSELKKDPKNPYTFFQIGQCYNMLHDDNNAYKYYSTGLTFTDDVSLEYVRMMITACGYNLLHMERFDEAIPFCQRYDAMNMDAPYFCMSGLVYLRSGQYIQAMQSFLKATSFGDSPIEGCNSYIPLYNMGLINEMLGNPEGAKALYQNCKDYLPAHERLKKL